MSDPNIFGMSMLGGSSGDGGALGLGFGGRPEEGFNVQTGEVEAQVCEVPGGEEEGLSLRNHPQLREVTMDNATAYTESFPVLLHTSGPLGEPPTVSPLLNSVIILEATATEDIWRLLAVVLSNKLAYKALLQLKDEKAQVILDILQKVNHSLSRVYMIYLISTRHWTTRICQ